MGEGINSTRRESGLCVTVSVYFWMKRLGLRDPRHKPGANGACAADRGFARVLEGGCVQGTELKYRVLYSGALVFNAELFPSQGS